ncbi:MAG: DUF4236 domain-containing protein [Bacteroidales bacterium]|nr:DUF4236 domain-containing protein [Bacteroidales bacterium]
MGFRFNKRITIFPWLKANVRKTGVSLTIGPKGKTLNIGNTGVSVNVNMGKGMSYNKRLFSWKSLNLLSWLGIGGAVAAKKTAKKPGKVRKDTSEVTLEQAIAEAEGKNDVTTPDRASVSQQEQQEQAGCSWGCAIFGCLGTLVIFVLIAIIIWLLIRDGSIDLSVLTGQQSN